MRKIKNIEIEGEHHRPIMVDLFYKESASPKDIVIFCHGYKGYKDWGAWNLVAETFAKQDFFFLKMNFSHNCGTREQPIDFPDLEAFGQNNFIKELDDLGLRENTTIILWSDHGYFLGEHGFWCKHSTFHEAVKIPFIISSAGYAKNQTTDSFTELVDVYPTLCELANITPPTYLHGKSLTPVLENPSIQLKDEIYTRYKQGEAIVDANYSYTEFYNGKSYVGNMMYDMKTDLKQNIDISKTPASSELVKTYSHKLKVMRDFVNKDPLNE